MERARNWRLASALLLGSTVLTGTSSAQTVQAGAAATAQANGSGKSQASSASLAAGTLVNAELDKSLDSKKAKAGDAVTARTIEAVKEDGKVVLPKGSKLTGHVTRASARGKGDSDSTLGLQFDRVESKDGQAMAVHLSLQAMAAAPGAAPIGGDDLQGMGSAGASAPMGGTNRGGVGAPVGGAASGAASTVPRTRGDTAPVNSTTSAAGGAAGASGAPSQGATGGLN